MKAACQHFGKCSGCTRQQFPYVKQLRDKQIAFAGHIKDLPPACGLKPHMVQEVTGSPLILGYRTTTKICLNEDAFGRRSIGLYNIGTKKVVDIPGCPVHHPAVEQIIDRLCRRQKPPAPFFEHGKSHQEDRLKFLTVRVCPVTGEAGVIISHTGVSESALKSWVACLDPAKVSVWVSRLTKADGDYVIGGATHHLCGPERSRYMAGDRTFRLSPGVFFQANGALIADFLAAVAAAVTAGLKPGRSGGTLLDLYGGFGAYAAAVAGRFDRVLVIDGNPQAIVDAQINTADLPNIQATWATVENALTQPAVQAAAAGTAILNPPRGGLSPKVRQLLSDRKFKSLRRIVYVSCNPVTLARDLGALAVRGNWQVRSLAPFDMFPQTDHLEVVAVMERVVKSAPKAAPRARPGAGRRDRKSGSAARSGKSGKSETRRKAAGRKPAGGKR